MGIHDDGGGCGDHHDGANNDGDDVIGAHDDMAGHVDGDDDHVAYGDDDVHVHNGDHLRKDNLLPDFYSTYRLLDWTPGKRLV